MLLVIGIIASIFITLFPIGWMTFYDVIERKETEQCDKKISETFNLFSDIGFSNKVFCSSQYRFASYDSHVVSLYNFSSSINEKDVALMPDYLQKCRINNFGDFVFGTKEHCYFTYIFSFVDTLSYVLFRTSWEENDVIEFVSSLDELPYTSSSPSFFSSDDISFSFYVRQKNNKYFLYRYSFLDNAFHCLSTCEQFVSYDDFNHVKKENLKKRDSIVLSFLSKEHITSFSSSCSDAYCLTSSAGFKPHSLYHFSHYSLCLYRLPFGTFGQAAVFSVFSYDWDTEKECFQGLYVHMYDGRFRFVLSSDYHC